MTPEQRLAMILYVLMRDEVVPGAVAKIVQDLEQLDIAPDYTAKGLAAYAEELAVRILKGKQ